MTVTSNQLVPGMVIIIQKDLFRVESAIKVTVAKGMPFIKTSLKNLTTEDIIEKNFKVDQEVKKVDLHEKILEFLYAEGKKFLFLDMGTLDHRFVEVKVIGESAHFLKEGVRLKAIFYGDKIFSVKLFGLISLKI